MYRAHRQEIEKWAAANAYTLIFMSILAAVEMVVIILVGILF